MMKYLITLLFFVSMVSCFGDANHRIKLGSKLYITYDDHRVIEYDTKNAGRLYVLNAAGTTFENSPNRIISGQEGKYLIVGCLHDNIMPLYLYRHDTRRWKKIYDGAGLNNFFTVVAIDGGVILAPSPTYLPLSRYTVDDNRLISWCAQN